MLCSVLPSVNSPANRLRLCVSPLQRLRRHSIVRGMGLDSKIFDSIRTRRKKSPSADDDGPKCQWDGCDKKGAHRAPVGREGEGQYLLFCLEHVKEYNRGYNYLSGLSDAEVGRYQKEAITGGRPTWGTGVNQSARDSPTQSKVRSGSAQTQNARRSTSRAGAAGQNQAAPARKLKVLEAKAFETLGLASGATADEIKARYKERLKLHHPDANQGDRGSEELLQATIEAHKILKVNGYC